MLRPEQRQYYAGEILKVLQGRDRSYMMSSADFDYLAKLMDREIPLAVVLLGIRQSSQPNGRVMLRYFRPSIEDRIDYWSKALA